jgi:hypothetical protein
MFVRVFVFFVLLSGSISCEFISNSLKFDARSQLIDTVIDLNHVDVFPAFKECDTVSAIASKNRCFTIKLYGHLNAALLSHTFPVNQSIDEVVRVHLKINKEGKSELVRIVASKTVNDMLPELDGLITQSIKTLPAVFPALKRGIPVTTLFEIPIVVKIE